MLGREKQYPGMPTRKVVIGTMIKAAKNKPNHILLSQELADHLMPLLVESYNAGLRRALALIDKKGEPDV